MGKDTLVSPTPDGVTVAIHVTPKARRQRIDGIVTDAAGRPAVKVAVTAPPEDGKANTAVIALLARAWRVPKGRIAIRSGATSRRKVLAITGETATLVRRIEDSIKGIARG